MALNCLGEVNCQAGDVVAAERAHREALGLSRDSGSVFEQARALAGLGRADALVGLPARAEQQWRQALDLFTQLGAAEAEAVREDLARLPNVTGQP